MWPLPVQRQMLVAELDRDRFGDGPVELTASSGTEHLQDDRPKLVVADVVRESLIADDPPIPVAETSRPTEKGRPMTAAT